MADKLSQLAPEPLPETASDLTSHSAQSLENAGFEAAQAEATHVHLTELRAARRAGTRWRGIARYLGLGIFLFGAGLMFYVFLQALHGFQEFSDVGRLNGQFNSMAGDNWVSSLQAVAAVIGKELLRVLYLFILGYIASAIAARGIQFFAASEAVIDEAVLPDA